MKKYFEELNTKECADIFGGEGEIEYEWIVIDGYRVLVPVNCSE